MQHPLSLKSASIIALKSKFFISRLLSYGLFLILPVYFVKNTELPALWYVISTFLFFSFFIGQAYLLGKEIDHRFKIYYRLNSSLDRILYRILIGKIFFLIIFNIFSLFAVTYQEFLYWLTWILLGLFYSWPTRGKIIQESVSSQFGEFRYLDPFEKITIILIVLYFLVSFPELPQLGNLEAFKLVVDPGEHLSSLLWNFLTFFLIPFGKYETVYRIGFASYFYIFGLGLLLFSAYAISRYFFSRRLSILTVFAIISTWSISKVLSFNLYQSFLSNYLVLVVWGSFWVARSSTYRTGLLLGVISFYGVLLSLDLYLFSLMWFPIFFLIFLRSKNNWFRWQVFRYSSLGLFIGSIIFLFSVDQNSISLGFYYVEIWENLKELLSRKAFYSLAAIGIAFLIAFNSSLTLRKNFTYLSGEKDINLLIKLILIILSFSIFISPDIFKNFSLIWILAFLSILPIEILFERISRLRSRRNMLYMMYLIICLLDSHLEGRIKILGQFII